jgi:catechol 2,3-dioxygenase-like lactoylglutathione lyase family enzyme
MVSHTIRFDHAALAAPHRDPIRTFILDLLGGTVMVEQRSAMADAGFRGVQIDIGGLLLEIIEPTNPSSFLHPYLAKRGPGLHHLTWYVADLDGFLDRLTARSIPLTGVERDSAGRASNAFIRPSASFGVLLQFRPLEEKTKEDRADRPDWQNLPPPRPTRGRLAAVTIASPDGDAALDFFQSFLGGTAAAPTLRGELPVRPLHAGGARLDFLTTIGPPGLHSLTFELTAFAETLAVARSMGLTILPGEHDCVVYLARTNPTGALFRFVDAG